MMRRATFVEHPSVEELATARGIIIGLSAATAFWALVAAGTVLAAVVTR